MLINLIDPQSLTVGERLEISRRRSKLTQKEAAELFGWSFSRYVKAEHGLAEEAAPSINDLTPGEQCRILRRRCGLSLKELEQFSGFKAKWIHRAETGQTRTAEPLVNFWLKLLTEWANAYQRKTK